MSGSIVAVKTTTFTFGFARMHLTARLQPVDLREVDVEHDHVGLEPLHGLQ